MTFAAGASAVLRTTIAAIGEYFVRSVSLLWAGPIVAALVVLPEFAQHVAEIQLGMFDSRAAALAAADHPLRMGFGYVKIAGLALTFLASARFWWCRAHGGCWYDLRHVGWLRLLIGFVLFMAIGSVPELAQPLTGHKAPIAAIVIASLLSLPFLFVMLAGLFGDRVTPLNTLILKSWPFLLLIALLLPLGFAPLSWLHTMNHSWAMGAPGAAVWALMIFDSLVVGLLASSVGAAMFVAYDRFHRSIAPTDAEPPLPA